MDSSQLLAIICSVVGTIGPAMWLFSVRLEKKATDSKLDLEQLKTEIQQIYGKFENNITKLSEQLSSLEQQSIINAQRLGTLEQMSREEYGALARYDERIKRLEQDVKDLTSKA
jgi:hypothetical protein